MKSFLDSITEKIKRETHPVWKRYYIEEKRYVSNPANWKDEGNKYVCTFDGWGTMCRLFGGEDEAIIALENITQS